MDCVRNGTVQKLSISDFKKEYIFEGESLIYSLSSMKAQVEHIDFPCKKSYMWIVYLTPNKSCSGTHFLCKKCISMEITRKLNLPNLNCTKIIEDMSD